MKRGGTPCLFVLHLAQGGPAPGLKLPHVTGVHICNNKRKGGDLEHQCALFS